MLLPSCGTGISFSCIFVFFVFFDRVGLVCLGVRARQIFNVGAVAAGSAAAGGIGRL